MLNPNKKTSNEKRASHFMNKKHIPKMKGSQRHLMKKVASCFMNKKHTLKMQWAQRPLMQKEASRFTNKKCTLKNARGSKTSDEK
jgi:hypothetical protein